MAQEIEDNYEHFDYIIDFVPTAYVLPRRRRVARCALRGEHATSSSSSIHERIEFVVYNRIVRSPRLYGIRVRRRRITVGTALRANRRRAPAGCPETKANCREYTVLYQANENSTSP